MYKKIKKNEVKYVESKKFICFKQNILTLKNIYCIEFFI